MKNRSWISSDFITSGLEDTVHSCSGSVSGRIPRSIDRNARRIDNASSFSALQIGRKFEAFKTNVIFRLCSWLEIELWAVLSECLCTEWAKIVVCVTYKRKKIERKMIRGSVWDWLGFIFGFFCIFISSQIEVMTTSLIFPGAYYFLTHS